jgi:serine/threonine-protein kinase RsbW
MDATSSSATWHHITIKTTGEVSGCVQALIDALTPLQYPERSLFGIRLALEEAIVNGVRHGNRHDPAKMVRIRYQLDAEQFLIEIEDEGPGFDPDGVPDPLAPQNLERPGGRGVFLMRYYMTWVSYNERGNCVTMCHRRTPLAGQPRMA